MNDAKIHHPVVIVGGGPVGLFLALCLHRLDIPCRVLEKRAETTAESRSFGIHPPSLELLQELGMAGSFMEAGLKIKRGHAFSNSRKIGSLSFEDCPGPFNFVLSLPQNRTERLLEQTLNRRNPRALLRRATVTAIAEQPDHVVVRYCHPDEAHEQTIRAAYVIGCDGIHSLVRQQAGFSYAGQPYPDTYVMGDFVDNTSFGGEAAIFLCREGLIESFPLPQNRRRWVIKTSGYCSSEQRKVIEQTVYQRIGHSLFTADHTMLSSFGVQKRIAEPMVRNRMIVAGDAAHVVSPIGGQGMNVGWLGARDLAQCLREVLQDAAMPDAVFASFQKRRYKTIRNSIRRSTLNMRLGRQTQYPALRNGLVSLMLNTPLAPLMARLFSMHGIERWII